MNVVAIEIDDITGSGLAHAPGEEDRVFRVTAAPTDLRPDGVYVVKVKSWYDPDASPLGRADVRMTASLCDTDGKVLWFAEDRPAVFVQPHVHTVQGAAQNVAEHVEGAMRTCVTDMITAIISTAAVRSVPGVGLVRKGQLK